MRGIAALAVQIGRVRAPLVAGLFGVLMALILYGTYRYAGYYWGFRGDLRSAIEDAIGQKITNDEYQYLEDTELAEESRRDGVCRLYQTDRARRDHDHPASGSSDSGLTLKGVILYIYWVSEIGLMAYIAAAGPYRRARKPFSEQTREWYGEAQRVGTIPAGSVSAFIERMQQGRLAEAGAVIGPESGTPPHTAAAIYRSSAPGDDLVLAVRWGC